MVEIVLLQDFLMFVFKGKVELKASKSNKDKFERNQTDMFLTEAVDLGDLTKIRFDYCFVFSSITISTFF